MPVPLILPPAEARRVLQDAALCAAYPTVRAAAVATLFTRRRPAPILAPFSGDAA